MAHQGHDARRRSLPFTGNPMNSTEAHSIRLTADTKETEEAFRRMEASLDRIIAKLDKVNQKAADAKRATADLSHAAGATEAAGAD